MPIHPRPRAPSHHETEIAVLREHSSFARWLGASLAVAVLSLAVTLGVRSCSELAADVRDNSKAIQQLQQEQAEERAYERAQRLSRPDVSTHASE